MPLGSFGVFETFRILIPGYIAALYASWYLALFFPRGAAYLAQSNLSTETFIGFGLIVGLLLYLYKKPGDSPDIRQLLPSHAVAHRAAFLGHPRTDADATNLYFYLLNHYFSDSMRERIFFYGNIYRVAQKAWLLSSIFLFLFVFSGLVEFVAHHQMVYLDYKTIWVIALAFVWYCARRLAAVHYKEILCGQHNWLVMRQRLVDALITNGHDPFAKP